jgi:Ca2+-binding EF-hand superfamily protein
MADYSEEEKMALRGIFSMYDQDGSGFIEVTELEEIMNKIGRNSEQAAKMMQEVDKVSGPITNANIR